MVGWVRNTAKNGTMEEHPVTCFYAEKDPRQIYEKQVGHSSKETVKFAQIEPENDKIRGWYDGAKLNQGFKMF